MRKFLIILSLIILKQGVSQVDTLYFSNGITVVLNYSINKNKITGYFLISNNTSSNLFIGKNADLPYQYLGFNFSYGDSVKILIGNNPYDILNDSRVITTTKIKSNKSYKVFFQMDKDNIVDKYPLRKTSEIKISFSKLEGKQKKQKKDLFQVDKGLFIDNIIVIKSKIPKSWLD